MLHQECAQPGDTEDRGVLERSGCQCQLAGWFPLFSCQGLLICTFTNRITLLLQYCQGKKRENERSRGSASASAWTKDRDEWRGEEAWDVSGNETDEEERERRGARGASNQESTSEREDAVDA